MVYETFKYSLFIFYFITEKKTELIFIRFIHVAKYFYIEDIFFFPQTSRGSGVLFYAVGGAPHHSHVTASVHAGKVLVSVAIGDEDLEVEAGIAVNDYR